ncbi:MAG: OadG family protein [Ruminiclostridium sp.]|nr:OadG family protein [Ruminiclostridium sp.]
MVTNLSAVLAAQELDWGLIGSTVVTGLVVVFLILAILVLFLWLFGKVFKGIGNLQQKKAQKAAEEAAAKKAAETKKPSAPAPVQASAVSETEYEEEDDDEIIAVIAAAIAAYGEAEGKQYRIASIKRPRTARSGWSAAGIADNMRGFIN